MTTIRRRERLSGGMPPVACLFLVLIVSVVMELRAAPGQPVTTRNALFSAIIDESEPRIWVMARLNGKAVRLMLDTATEVTSISRDTAKRLGLRVTELGGTGKAPPGKVRLGATKCRVRFGKLDFPEAVLGVFNLPRSAGRSPASLWEGLLGWEFLRRGILAVDWDARRVEFLDQLPIEAKSFVRWELIPDSPIPVARVQSPGIGELRMVLDTGSQSGIALGPSSWQEWTKGMKEEPLTLVAGYSPGTGIYTEPVRWSRKFELAGASIEGIPVSRTRNSLVTRTWNAHAVMGLIGLSRFKLYLDGLNNCAYIKPRRRFAWEYEYNRLGAVFVPPSLEQNALIAHVAPDSPASRAGISKGDELLRVQSVDATRWKTNAESRGFSRFFEGPAGTELRLRVKRGDTVREVVVKLEEIFPDAKKHDPLPEGSKKYKESPKREPAEVK